MILTVLSSQAFWKTPLSIWKHGQANETCVTSQEATLSHDFSLFLVSYLKFSPINVNLDF